MDNRRNRPENWDNEKERNRREQVLHREHEQLTEQIYYEVRRLTRNQTEPVNYLVVIIVSIISSGLTTWLLTHSII